MTNGSKKYAAEGFTYLEMLLSLMTAALIMAVMPNVMILFQALTLHEDHYDTDIFMLDIIETYNTADVVDAAGGSVINFKTDRGDVTYRYSSGRIIKSIDNAGFVTLMFNIESFVITETKESITLQLKGAADETLIFKK
ncbi:MAG: competence type IV pilus minor pilin ComGF [Jeotgalicoccus sp.]